MKNVIRVAVFAGLGLYDRVRDEIEELVKRGELLKQEGEDLLAEAKAHETARLKGFQERAEAAVRSAIEKIPRPANAKEVAALTERIRVLETRLADADRAQPAM